MISMVGKEQVSTMEMHQTVATEKTIAISRSETHMANGYSSSYNVVNGGEMNGSRTEIGVHNGVNGYGTVSINGGQIVHDKGVSNGLAILDGSETLTEEGKLKWGKIVAVGGARVLKLVTEVGRGPLMNTEKGEEITKDIIDSAIKEKAELQLRIDESTSRSTEDATNLTKSFIGHTTIQQE